MSEPLWTTVDEYVTDLLLTPDPVLDATLAASAAAGLPQIQVSAPQGKLLSLLARAQCARRILEIGTLGGYSTIWLARALQPGGQLTTLERDPKHAAVARANIANAGFTNAVEVMVGPACETLQRLIESGAPAYDFIFIDADKPGYPEYFGLALQLARPGTLIVADNIVRDGAVADPNSVDPNVLAVRRYNALVAAEPRVTATVLQTVGAKGYDGFSLALVEA